MGDALTGAPHDSDPELLAEALGAERYLQQRQQLMNVLLGRVLPPSYARDAVLRQAVIAHCTGTPMRLVDFYARLLPRWSNHQVRQEVMLLLELGVLAGDRRARGGRAWRISATPRLVRFYRDQGRSRRGAFGPG